MSYILRLLYLSDCFKILTLRDTFYVFSRQSAPANRSRLHSTPASANTNNKNQQTIAVVNITDDSMFKEQELETGVENDKPKQTPQELERVRKAKEEELSLIHI